MSAKAAPLLNYLSLQAGWLACVLGAAQGRAWLGPVVVAVLVALHLARHPCRRREALVVLCVAPLGTAVDSAQQALGWIRYVGQPLLGLDPLAPAWIAALWVLFPTTFHASLGWLRRRPVLAALFGAVGGPLGYLGGERLGALTIGADRWPSLAGLALAWGLAMPALLALAERIGRPSRDEPAVSVDADPGCAQG